MNTIRISFAQNPRLKDFFGRQSVGNVVEIEVKFTIKSIDGDEVTGSLSKVGLPDDEITPGEEDKGPVETNALEPAAILIGANK